MEQSHAPDPKAGRWMVRAKFSAKVSTRHDPGLARHAGADLCVPGGKHHPQLDRGAAPRDSDFDSGLL
jgi:hypothetical protein